MLTWNGKEIKSVVVGSTVPTDETATTEDIKLGKTASVNGVKVTGTAKSTLSEFLKNTTSPVSFYYIFSKNVDLTDEMVSEMFDEFDMTERVTNFKGMFESTNITVGPNISTKNATDMSKMFNICYSLKELPLYDTSKVTTLDGFITNSRYLKEPPHFNTENVTIMRDFCFNCTAIEKIPLYDTRKVQDFGRSFTNMIKLKVFPALDFRSCTATTAYGDTCFKACSALEEIWIKNIKASLSVGGGIGGGMWGHLIKKECLIHLIRELRDTGVSKTLTMGSTNLAKITGNNAVYVRLIEIMDEMRAEDDLIDEKLPFELCESTDEGAILITEYTQLKNWQLA